MKEALEQIVLKVPYNSFTIFLEQQGIPFLPDLGGSCITLNKTLAECLYKKGYSPRFVSSDNGFIQHYATICRDGKNLYYLDPFVMHLEPIPLSKTLSDRRKISVNALPQINNQWSQIVVEPLSKKEYHVHLYGLIRNKHSLIHTYTYDIEDAVPFLPEADSKDFVTPKKKLGIRLVDEINNIITLALDPNTGGLSVNVSGEERKTFRKHISPKSFDDLLRKGCKSYSFDSNDLIKSTYVAFIQYSKLILNI